MLLTARSRRFALWLALAAMLLRGLLPDGVMLGRGAENGSFGYLHCTGSVLQAQAPIDGKRALTAVSHCPFSVLAMPGLLASPMHGDVLSLFAIEAPVLVARLAFVAGTKVLPPARGPPLIS